LAEADNAAGLPRVYAVVISEAREALEKEYAA